jgi:predicted PurR-regulated permease PerM
MDLWDNFWSVFSGLFGVFVFIAYLTVLFTIIADLLRDHTLPGWAKAVWLLFLMFVPFLTALVYVIMRGSAMAARESARYQRGREYVDDSGATIAGHPVERMSTESMIGQRTIDQAEYNRIQDASLRE